MASVATQAMAAGLQLTDLVVLPSLEQARCSKPCCHLQVGEGISPCCGTWAARVERLRVQAVGLAPGTCQAPQGVVRIACVDSALAAQYFLVQIITLNVADELVHG